MTSVEYELKIAGVPRHFELRMVPSGEDEVVTIVRDFTEQRRAEAEQRRLAEEQAALRRVATLVAADIAAGAGLPDVTEEVCRLLGIPSAVLERFESGEKATIVARYGDRFSAFEVGMVIDLEEGLASRVSCEPALPARVETYEGVPGEIGERVRAIGVRSAVAVPISVAGATWGALVATFGADETEPPHTERRMQAFAELVALGRRERAGARRARGLAAPHRRGERRRAAPDSSATSTTAPSSGSSRSRSRCGSPRQLRFRARTRRRSCSSAPPRS